MTKTGIQVNNAQYTTFKHEGWQLGLDQHNFGDDADKPSVKKVVRTHQPPSWQLTSNNNRGNQN